MGKGEVVRNSALAAGGIDALPDLYFYFSRTDKTKFGVLWSINGENRTGVLTYPTDSHQAGHCHVSIVNLICVFLAAPAIVPLSCYGRHSAVTPQTARIATVR